MNASLSNRLVAKLQERAADPARRSGSEGMSANSISLDEMLGRVPKSNDPAVKEYLDGVNSPLEGMMSNLVSGNGIQAKGLMGALGAVLGGNTSFATMGDQTISMGAQPKSGPAPPPASEADLAATEAQLGFALPPELRQFYTEVANGGVGMGDGIYGLDRLVAKYRELTCRPAGPQGQDWPRNLLPIQGEDYELVSIDRDSGKLIFWDLEDLDDDEDLPADNPSWAESFRHEADSLEEWLGKWAGDR